VIVLWKFRTPIDLAAVFLIALSLVLTVAFFPPYIFWMILVMALFGAGFGLFKWFKSRG